MPVLSHGESTTAFYAIWNAMMGRCYRRSAWDFGYYGARGIGVCPKWHDFLAFKEDMRKGWAKGLHLDRIDNDGYYMPGNCRWVSREDSMRNRRRWRRGESCFIHVGH